MNGRLMKRMTKTINWILLLIGRVNYTLSYNLCRLLPNKLLGLYLEICWKIEDIMDKLGCSSLFYISAAPEEMTYQRNYQYKIKKLYEEERLLYVGSSKKAYYYFDKKDNWLYASKIFYGCNI